MNRVKQWGIIALIVAVGGTMLFGQPSMAQEGTSDIDVAPGAQAAICADATSGRVLYGKNVDDEMLIASLTKIMTAIVAIESGKLDELVTVGPRAVGVEGSSIYLKQGEKIPLITLLYGLMLRSGNDAAVAIAEHIGGSVEGFVYLMNRKAEYMGLEHTHFANPHGLDAEGHYSSARDLAVLTSYALKNPTFQEIVKTEVKTVPWPGEKWNRKFYNKNKMLRLYKWADGVKTGYTKKARRTLVASATKEGHQLVTVTLNDGDDWRDSMNMLEYGFQQYDLVPILQKGQVVSKRAVQSKEDKLFDVIAGTSFSFPLTDQEKGQVVVEPIISFPLKLVRHDQQQVGSARIFLREEQIGAIPLVVKFRSEPSVFRRFKDWLGLMVWQGERR
ncbi:D-alanyl-D-alanine carboxypeptidase family protein [Laceyella putida]|uniref:serine-type D-Ala-D-Ala carboxypeptidase n=1 Tax=Laceyella putida TaxID=110101 RepID=A0ABW2RMC2_9BACL